VRTTYNLSPNLGIGVGTSLGNSNGALLVGPFAAVTYTLDLNNRFSPFFEVGAGVNRFSGNSANVTSNYAVFGGVGVRSMIGNDVALRVEVRMAYDKYSGLSSAAYNGGAFVGLSYFMGGGPPRASRRRRRAGQARPLRGHPAWDAGHRRRLRGCCPGTVECPGGVVLSRPRDRFRYLRGGSGRLAVARVIGQRVWR
jgi:hypothetical protein